MELKDITKEAVLISEDATFAEALSRMISSQTNTLLVTNSDGELCGEVGVTDLLDAVVPEYMDGDSIIENLASEDMFKEAVKEAAEKPVMLFMNQDYSAINLNDDLVTVAATALGHQRARIPVVDADNHPIGIISRQGLKHILATYLGISNPH